MSDLATIRERIEQATGFFETRHAAVLTTFNLNGQFLEEQILPVVLGVEAPTVATRSAALHGELAKTPCTVYYDPTVSTGVSGKFRYVARPVPCRGRLFHPKLVVIAGVSHDRTWVYLAVMSANLTLSGWARNAESFGETWIHTKRQQAWSGLDKFLEWLQTAAPLGELPDSRDAIATVRATLDRMENRYLLQDDETQPWSGKLKASFYASVVHEGGLPSFLQKNYFRKPAELWAYSPYWGDVRELVREFGAKRTALLPAQRVDGNGLGLSRSQADALGDAAEIWRYTDEAGGDRFWHMKAYWLQRGKRKVTAVGSCNFTRAGLGGPNGNVEAMLIYEDIEPAWPEEYYDEAPELATESEPEEEVPTPAPVAIVVAYDWQAHKYRWYLDADASAQRDFRLSLPGLPPFRIGPGWPQARPGKPPHARGATFKVTYRQRSDRQEWQGQIVELHLDHSQRTYGKPLAANDILESWRTGVALSGSGLPRDRGDGDDEGEDTEAEVPAAFDAVNLYDLYRATRGLRARLEELESRPDEQYALLVRRPDSVMAFAKLASGDGEGPAVRYLVLQELAKVARDYEGQPLERDLVRSVATMKGHARQTTLESLVSDLGGDRAKARRMLGWFERRLSKMDGEGT